MKNLSILFLTLFSIVSFAQKNPKTIGFIENKGQIVDQKGKSNPLVHYLLNTNGLNVQLRNNGFSYDIYETKKVPLKKKDKMLPPSDFGKDTKIQDSAFEYKYHRIDIDFLNSNADVKLLAEEKSVDYDNYYNVASAPKGITDVHKYKKVIYQNIYNHIDVVFFIPKDVSKAVEYNFVVRPGGKASDIQLEFKGAKTELEANKIKMAVRFGQMEETLPTSWEENGSARKELAIGYKEIKKNVYGFDGEINASDKTIVIDPVPVRLWGTYYGGEGNEFPSSITTNANNDVYIAGGSGSTINIATSGSNQSSLNGNYNIFIAKLDTNGTRIWGTYFYSDLGGGNSQNPLIKTDSNNNLYFTAKETFNTNLGTPGTFQPLKSLFNDVFLIKLNDFGVKVWGTYYGGNKSEEPQAICIDSSDNVYISGSTASTNVMASAGAHQTVNNSIPNYQDAFIAKFDSNGNRLWGTFYGGTGSETFNNLSISNDGFLYATGVQHSNTNIATPGSYQSTTTTGGGMIVKFDLNGNRIWGTYIADDSDIFNAKLKGNNLYFIGRTSNKTTISTPGVLFENFQAWPTDSNVGYYIINFDIQLQQKIWGTYFLDTIIGVDANNNNEVFISGDTRIGNGITTPNSYMPILPNIFSKNYIVKFNTLGQRIWGTYYGGDRSEIKGNIILDNNQNLYLYGLTYSSTTGIATVNSHQDAPGSNIASDAFLVKFFDCQSSSNATSNSPICIGQNLQLNASGGTGYAWMGPNGFTSNSQNPIITNANASHNGQYTCIISGTGGCDGPASVDVVVGDTKAPVVNVQNLPTITGDCNTMVSIVPTAIDNCAGTINATTTDPLSYSIPGNYTIHWNYNDGNGNASSQSQDVVITATTLPTLLSPQEFCIQQNATLNTIPIAGQNIQWYDALTNGNVLAGSTVLQNGITYYASQTSSGCESLRVPVTINIYNTPAPTGGNQSFCATQNPTLADVLITGTGINWYSSVVSTTVLSGTTALVNGTTYYATQTLNGCESANRLSITVTLINTLNANNYAEILCDDLDDGNETINLTTYNTNLISNTSGCTFEYYNSVLGATNQTSSDQITNPTAYTLALGLKTIYVRITSSNGCHQIVELQLTLVSKPFISILDIMPICAGNSITVDAGSGYDTYLWSTGEMTSSIVISNPGNYDVTVSENHGTSQPCISKKSFSVVQSNMATISEVITSDWTNNENTVTVLLTGSSVGNYEYSLDGIHYQDSNTFSGLESGEYTVFVKDKNGCGIRPDEFYLLMYPKFFTPNGDGFNDTWQIKFSKNEPNLTVKLFDRFGKLLKEIDNKMGWNGTLNNQELPATDYWFVVTRGNGKEYRGHFALKR